MFGRVYFNVAIALAGEEGGARSPPSPLLPAGRTKVDSSGATLLTVGIGGIIYVILIYIKKLNNIGHKSNFISIFGNSFPRMIFLITTSFLTVHDYFSVFWLKFINKNIEKHLFVNP